MPSPGGMSSPGNSRPATPMGTPAATPSHATPHSSQHAMAAPPTPAALQAAPITPQEQTTLLHNEEESFALAPVEPSSFFHVKIHLKDMMRLFGMPARFATLKTALLIHWSASSFFA